MQIKKIILYGSFVILFILIGISYGDDWLEGGYVGSYRGDIGQYFTDPIFYTNPTPGQPIQSRSSFYPGRYGAFSNYPSAYNSDFRLNSLARMNWTPYQPNWSKTMQYAQQTSSFRVYPRPTAASPSILFTAPEYITTNPLAGTTGDATVTIVSQNMRGYQVFLDGNYIGTEGMDQDPLLDGRFTFKVIGNQNHEIRVYDGQFNYPKTIFFDRGGTKIIYVEPGTAIYV